ISRPRRDRSGSGRDVEQARSCTGSGRFEQRWNGERGDRREEVTIGRGQAIVALTLELAQTFGILCGEGQACTGHEKLQRTRRRAARSLSASPTPVQAKIAAVCAAAIISMLRITRMR